MLESSTLTLLSASTGLRRLEAQLRASVGAVGGGPDAAAMAANRETERVLLEAATAADRIDSALRRALLDVRA